MRNRILSTIGVLALTGAASFSAQADFTANISVSNNYLWRGLTQTTNDPALSGGIDYAHESGIYIGTWVSNVDYGDGDAFSYENDLYIGYAGEYEGISYDFGFLYYNYDEEADFDFGEIYGSLGYKGLSVTAYVLTHTEADESDGIANAGRRYDLGFGSTYYISGDYSYEIRDGLELGFHVGYHDGDFVDSFNFANGTFDYWDYNISISKGGFSFLISDTDLDDSGDIGFQNGSVKYVVSYTVDFDL